jgi:acetylornithine aminotransferase
MLEPIQGESGVKIPDSEYLNKVQDLCEENDWLLILDEVQTGIGRTGKLFAHQHNNIIPDLLTLAKGLGNGVPIGACLAKGKASKLLVPGTHGSTFGGNPLVCKTALTVLEVIERDLILENVCKIGEYLKSEFEDKMRDSNKVTEIRSKGLMIAIELNQDCSILLQRALENKLLINITGQTIRLLPPLIISMNEADILINKVCNLIEEL